jgi:hypothetical protein
VYFPNLNPKKVRFTQIKLSIWGISGFYLGRTVLMVAVFLLGVEITEFNYDYSRDYWVYLKLSYYLCTDLLFLVILNLIIREQSKQSKEVNTLSEGVETREDSELERTFIGV